MSARAKAYAAAVALWLLVVGGALATRKFKKGLFGPDGLESMAYLVLLLGFASSQRVRALLAAIGTSRRLAVVTLVGLVLWGQLARDNRISFPFLQWSMYTEKNPPNAYLEYEVRYRSGATGLFRFGDLTAFAGAQGRVIENRITKAFDPEKGGGPDVARAEIEKLVATYNRRFAENPVVHLSVVRLTVPIRGFAGRESIARESLLEVDFDG